jgi:ribonuclease HI
VVAGRGQVWIPPPEGWVKINVDAAVGKNNGVAALAAIARSATGRYLGASSVIITGRSEPETLACREALALASDMNERVIRVASDCLNAVNNSQNGTLGACAHIATDK